MLENKFWNLISLFDWSRLGDDSAVMSAAKIELMKLGPEEICKFDDWLALKLHDLDTREHCRYCFMDEANVDDGDEYISADEFLYSRCVVVANGKNTFESILSDATQMPRDGEFEAILYLAEDAYEELTGIEYDHIPAVIYESFQNADGWKRSNESKPGAFTSESVPRGNRRPL